MRRDEGLSKFGNWPERVIYLVGPQSLPLGRPRGLTVIHVERGLAFGMVIDLCQLTLYDQRVAVLR